VEESGASDVYQWQKDGTDIAGATSASYTIASADFSDAGSYTCTITNTVATGLTIYTRPVNISVIASGRYTDSLALVSLYNSLDGPNWTDNTNWPSDSTLDTWARVTVSGGRVTDLNLNGNNPSGSIPPEIGNLTALTGLNMDGYGLTGTLPPELGNLTSLFTLGITYTSVTGSIPTEIFSLTNLTNLYLYSNNLTGTLPAEVGNLTNLYAFMISNNDLEGELPEEIGNLTSLQTLYIFGNNFSGSLPSSLGNLIDLEYFYAYNNSFSGDLPSSLGNLTKLKSVTLYTNSFTGAIPAQWGSDTSLTDLNIRDNQFTDLPDLSGATNLENLYVRNNRLTFEDIEPNIGVPATTFEYSPQDSVGQDTTILILPGGNTVLRVDVGGTANQYEWFFNGSPISGATADSLEITNADEMVDEGDYICKITNTIATGLILYSRPVHLDVNSDAGMVAYYPFNGNAGDESGNGNDGTINNGVTLTTDRFGNGNSAFLFNGVNGCIEIGDKFDDSQTLSFAAWVKFDENALDSAYYGIIEKYDDSSNSLKTFSLVKVGWGENRHKIMSKYYDGTTTDNSAYSLNQVQPEKWLFVASTFDNGTNKIFINGLLKDEKIVSSFILNNNNTSVTIGNDASNEHPMKGKIDDVRIYDRILSQEEIDSLYHLHGWNGGNDITFQVNMSMQLELGNFDSTSSDVWVRGNFNGWTNDEQVLSDPDLDGIYTLTHTIEADSAEVIEYKFIYRDENDNVVWESSIDNRRFQLTGGPEILPVVYFDNYTPRQNDSLALAALYDALGGDSWTDNTNWKSENEPIDNWVGVSMTGNRVTRLDLKQNNLVGEIPPEIGNLTALKVLYLGNNDFGGTGKTGSSPVEDKITLLESGEPAAGTSTANKLAGGLPPEIGNLKNLTTLRLPACNLNQPLPAEMGNLSNLQILDLSENPMNEGMFPASMANLNTITYLFLSKMGLNAVPDFVFSLTNIGYLSLWRNNISSLPAEIGNLTSLSSLDLDENQLTSLPPEFANLTNLEVLWISNPFGKIPPEISSLPKLIRLGLWGCGLSDADVADVNKFPASLELLYLKGNNLTVVPPVLSDLPNLKSIYLQDNQITDDGLGEFTTFNTLEYISLSGNQLSVFPGEILNHSDLMYLILDHNRIEGGVPEGINNLDTLRYLFVNNNSIDELPVFSLSNLAVLYADSNLLTFEDIEPNLNAASSEFRYSPQNPVGAEIDTTAREGDSFTMSVNVGGSANSYQWYKDTNPISGATESSYTINSMERDDEGDYFCEISNSNVPNLTLSSHPVHLRLSYVTTVFQVDMSIAVVKGLFDPAADSVVIGGTIDGIWQTSPGFEKQSRYIYTLDAEIGDETTLNYSYLIRYANGDSLVESIPLRSFNVVDYDTTLPVVYFNDDNTVTISQIQQVSDPAVNDTSVLYGKEIKVNGIMMNNPRDIQLGTRWGAFIQEMAPVGEPWHGILVIQHDTTTLETGFQDMHKGDLCTFTGIVEEYHGFTQVSLLTYAPVFLLSSGNPLPNPLAVNSLNLGNTAAAEPYEGMLVHLNGAIVVRDSIGGGRAELTDNNGEDFYLDDYFKMFYDRITVNGGNWPEAGTNLNVTGFVTDMWRTSVDEGYNIAPRNDDDIADIASLFEQDSLALVALYNATGGPNWTNRTNWLSSQQLSTWYGVTVLNGRVTELVLSQNNLNNNLPAEFAGLTGLRVLELNLNQLSGGLENIGTLKNLESLILSENSFDSEIPETLFLLSNLKTLDLSNCNFSGKIPSSIADLTRLVSLNLDGNNLSGAVPGTLIQLADLENIHLLDNDFDGLPNLTSLAKITSLHVEKNKLTFEDIEPNVGINGFVYWPQDSVGRGLDTTIAVGESFEYLLTVGGIDNAYKWYKDGNPTVNESNYIYNPSVTPDDAGTYILHVTNTTAPNLTLYSKEVKLTVLGDYPEVNDLRTEEVTVTTAMVSARVNPGNMLTALLAFYGESEDNLDHTQEVDPVDLDGTTIERVRVFFSGLKADTKYFYQIRAENVAGTVFSSKSNFTTHSYPAVLTADTTISTLPNHPSPSDYSTTDYRLVGLPGNTGISVSELLNGEAEKDWMVYWDDGTDEGYAIKYNSGDSRFKFTLGRAFWLVTTRQIVVNRNIQMPSLTERDEIAIPLHEGWNLITDPFFEPVNWNTIKVRNNINWPLYYYEAGWKTNQTEIKPFHGYLILNTDNRNDLLIPYPTSLNKQPAELPREWAVDLTISGDDFEETVVNFGIAPDATMGKDELEFCKPRMFKDNPGAWFNRPEWDEKYSSYAEDYRPEIGELQSWDFDVTVPKNEEIELRFSGIEDIPAQYDVILFNMENKTSHSLMDNPVYSFTSPQMRGKFEVIIGEPEMVEEKIASMLPKTFTLEPNFPNPFNPTTVIPVEIPEESDVTIEIFNILGKRIKTLHKGVLGAGRHLLTWDGSNLQGNTMPSGIYFCRLRSSTGATFTRKMILMK
jgi:Leucine-rich repeat (LRR) protein